MAGRYTLESPLWPHECRERLLQQTGLDAPRPAAKPGGGEDEWRPLTTEHGDTLRMGGSKGRTHLGAIITLRVRLAPALQGSRVEVQAQLSRWAGIGLPVLCAVPAAALTLAGVASGVWPLLVVAVGVLVLPSMTIRGMGRGERILLLHQLARVVHAGEPIAGGRLARRR